MSVSGLLRPTAARATESLHGVFGSAKCGARRHNKSCNNDVLHNPRVVVDGLLPRSKREAIDSLSQVLYLGKCIYKSIWNHNGFAQWCVDHGDTASLREMSLRGPVSAQNSYIATQFVSLPVKIDSIQELKREFDLYVNYPRSQFEVAESDQVSPIFLSDAGGSHVDRSTSRAGRAGQTLFHAPGTVGQSLDGKEIVTLTSGPDAKWATNPNSQAGFRLASSVRR